MAGSQKNTSIKRMVAIILLTLFAGVAVFFLVSDHILTNAVPRAKVMGFSPSKTPVKAQIDCQTESHTCGLHSIISIYRAHGLDPADHALRTRLGVDTAAVPTQNDTLGTIQPDITRVLAQDGFKLSLLDLDSNHRGSLLERHLTAGQLALVLIRKPDNGALHWIVLQQVEPGTIEVIDSLRDAPYTEPTSSFLQTKAVTIFLLSVQPEPSHDSIKKAHRLGITAMKKTPSRVNLLEESNPP